MHSLTVNIVRFKRDLRVQDHIRIASVDVANTDTGYAAAVSTPLDMNLKSGIEIQLDGAKFAQVAFSSCINTGCVAELS